MRIDRRLRLETNAFRTNRDQEEYDQTNTGIDVSVTWQWREFWRQSLGYRIQQIELDNFEDDASGDLYVLAGAKESMKKGGDYYKYHREFHVPAY